MPAPAERRGLIAVTQSQDCLLFEIEKEEHS